MITNIDAGLSAEHVDTRPLLDRIELQRHGRIQGRRTYADGIQYLIFKDPLDSSTNEPAWSRFVPITSTGVDLLHEIIRDDVLSYSPTAEPSGPRTGTGTIIWVAYVDGEEHVVQTASGNYNALPAFVQRLDEAVSQNVQRAE
jgi:hypothetical protein